MKKNITKRIMTVANALEKLADNNVDFDKIDKIDKLAHGIDKKLTDILHDIEDLDKATENMNDNASNDYIRGNVMSAIRLRRKLSGTMMNIMLKTNNILRSK